jgi:hypothetical protein
MSKNRAEARELMEKDRLRTRPAPQGYSLGAQSAELPRPGDNPDRPTQGNLD